MTDLISGKKDVYETSYRIKMKNGKYINFFDYGKIIEKDGDKIVISGLVFKVNSDQEIKEIKNDILANNELFNLIKNSGKE